MEKYGRDVGMARFRKCKSNCGYREVVSYKGGTQSTSWVKKSENAKPAAASPPKPPKPAAASPPKPPKPAATAVKPDWASASPYGGFGGGWGCTTTAPDSLSANPPVRARRRRQNAAGQETDSFGNPIGFQNGSLLFDDSDGDEAVVPILCVKDGKDDC